MGAVEIQSLGYYILVFVSCDSVPVDAEVNFFRDRGCFSRGAFLYFGEGTGHRNRVRIPPDTT